MDIKIKNYANDFTIDNYIIRDVRDREGSSLKPAPHLQVRVSRNSRSKKKHIKCLVSYFDRSGEFLGLDEAYGYHESGLTSEIICSLNIPPNATDALCEFRDEYDEKGFYFWAGRAATILVLVLLSMWVVKYFR